MIELRIQPYCEACGDFKAKIEKNFDTDFFGDIEWHTVITCKNESRCESIKRYLQRRSDEE